MENGTEQIQLELRKFVAPEYIFGLKARHLAGNFCRQLGGRKVFIVTDFGITKTPWLKELEDTLLQSGMAYVIFSSISSNPRDYEVMEGVECYRENKCNIILAFGGGSVLDAAKGIGIVSTNHLHISSFEGVDKIERPMPPLICIPTTGGTAADVSQFAIINNYTERYKMAIISKSVVPDVSLIDPEILTSMDPFLTACTGIDALSHAFEAYISNASSPVTDLYALEAIRLIHTNLQHSYANPENLQSRGKIMLASLYAGLAFSNASLGCVHSMSHSLGGFYDLPHGECNAILLPHVVDFNFRSATERFINIAKTLNLSISGLSESQIKNTLIDYLKSYNLSLGISTGLTDKHVNSNDIPVLSGKAIKDPCNATNPRPPVRKDLEVIYSEAM
jgi:alcohol dehydrogenase